MLSTPEATVVFSEEDQKTIDAAKSVLLNVEAEITSHNKVLKTLKAEIVKAKEEAEYVESIVDRLNSRHTELADSLTAVTMARAEVIEETNAQTEQNKQTRAELTEWEAELDKREQEISGAEQSLAQERATLSKEKEDLTRRQQAVDKAEKAFADASLTITWKSTKE